MPNEELAALVQGYATNAPIKTDLSTFDQAPGISAAEHQATLDSGKGWFSENLSFNVGGEEAAFARTPEQLDIEQSYYQNNWEKAGAGLLRTGNKFLTEVAKLPGVAAGLVEARFTDKSIGESLDNFWINGLEQWESYVNEDVIKVHVPQSVREGGLWKNLSSASFWATEGADGVGFLTSMLVPGNLLKLAKLGARGVNLFNAGNQFLAMSKGVVKGLSKTQSLRMAAGAEKLGVRAAENIDNITAAAVNSTIEAAAEAKETFDNSMTAQTQKYLKENGLEEGTPLPKEVEDEFKMKAGEASSSVFMWNAALLLGPNLLDQRLLFGAFGARKSGLSKTFEKMFKDGVLEDFTSQSIKQAAKRYLGEGLMGIGKEGFFEEGSQFAVSEYFKNQAVEGKEDKKGFFESGVNNFQGIVDTYIDNLDNVDMRKAIALGSVLGGGMSVIGEIKTSRYQDKAGRELHAQLKNNLVNRLNSNLNEAIVYNDKGEMEMENGKPKMDMEKVLNLFTQNDNQLTLSKLADIAALSGNKEDYHLFQSVIDFNYFQPFFQQGEEGIAILKQHIQNQLSESEAQKLKQESLLDLTNTTEVQRAAQLLTKVDEFYKLYDNITNRHMFDMPKLEGGKKADKAEFSNLILAKKLEKVILKDQLSRITLDLKNSVFNLASKNIIDPTTKEVIKQDPDNTFSNEYTLLPDLSESDQKELDLIGAKEKQYSEVYKKIKEDNDLLYNKKELADEYKLWLAAKEAKKAEEDVKDISDKEVVDKLSKDLAAAGYVMDREHVLDPEKKAKMTPEELQAFIGNDRIFTFELNGKEYEAYSDKNPDGTTYRVYRDAASKKVIGKFDIEFLRKNRGIKIISKQEVMDRRKLAKLIANKEAKLKAFTAIYNSLNEKLKNNEAGFIDLENQKRVIEEEIATYQEWLKSITNESGYRAINGKALEKQQVKQELASLEKMLDALDSQITELNSLYEELQGQLGMLEQIQQDVNIVKEDNLFKSESDNIAFTDTQRKLKQDIADELARIIEEEQQLADIVNTTAQTVAKAEQELINAVELEAEIQIIYEDLNRVKDINEIVNALLTADPNDLNYILAKYKPLKLVVANLAKLRDNAITDEEYLKVISIANNLLNDKYLGYGPEGLAVIKEDILRAANNANKLPISNEAQYYIDANYFMPIAMAEKFVLSKNSLLASANRMLEQAIGKQYAAQDIAGNNLQELEAREGTLNGLLNDLFVQYRKALNRSVAMKGKITFNNESPDEQAPEVYEDDNGTINPASYLSNYVFRNIGQDLDYDIETGQTEDGGNGLPKLNLSDQNYRRLAQFIRNNPKLAEKYNVRFFVGRTDADGKKSVDIGGKSNDELLGLYETFESSPGSLDIGFYFVDKDGKVASENYNAETKTVIGWIPKGVTDTKGNMRINNAAAVRIVTAANGVFYDIKTNNKFINDYRFSVENDVYTFQATNYKKESNITVEIIDGKAVINARYDNSSLNTSEVELSEEKATLIADLLKENTKYSLSKAGKEIQGALKESKTKYKTNINLTRTKTDLIENQGIIDIYGEVTVDELIAKVKEELVGKPGKEGLYTAMVINPIVEQIETNKKPAFTRIQTITRGVPIKQYNTNPDGTRNFQEPISNKITDVFSVELKKGELDGGTLDIVNFTNQDTLGSSLGKVVLKTDNGETVPLDQRNLDSNEILTALYIMSFGDNMAQEAPEFGVTKDGKPYRMDTGDGKFHSRYRFFPFSKASTGSAITSLLYWGKHTDDSYINAEGKEIPISSNKVGEIFAHEGNIYFKKKVDKGVWIDSSVSIDSLKEAMKSENPLQDPAIRDLVDFLADKKVNVNKQLLLSKEDKMKTSLYFHPKVTKTAEGYEFTYDTYNSYAEFLIKNVLTTTVNNEENFPKFANRQIVFRSKNQLKPDISESFVKPETTARKGPMKNKNSAASKAASIKDTKSSDKDIEKEPKKVKRGLSKLRRKAIDETSTLEEIIAEEIENEAANAKDAKDITVNIETYEGVNSETELTHTVTVRTMADGSKIIQERVKGDQFPFSPERVKGDQLKLPIENFTSLDKGSLTKISEQAITSQPKASLTEELENAIINNDNKALAESKALEILNRYAERSDNVTEYQGDEFEGLTSEDEEGPSTTTLSKITNAIKSLPPVPYNLTSKSIEEFKEKLRNELLNGGLDNMIDDVLSNIDTLVNEQLDTLKKEPSEFKKTSTVGLTSPKNKKTGKFAALANKTKKVC
jgi:hypothetical protein